RLLLSSLLFSSTTATMDLRSITSLYTVPTCAFRQSCLFTMDDFRFEMCSCPNGTECSSSFTAIHQGTRYNFCSDPRLGRCSSGDLSVTIDGLQTTLHCTCTRPMVERKIVEAKSSATKFVCEMPVSERPISPKMVKLMNFWKYRSAKYQEKGAMDRRRRKQSLRCQSKTGKNLC
ncbi:hypothetical protein PFISCL1PPCAC_28054, partial [Pristionchus fissidentatus]